MSAEWNRGVLTTSSWHGLEEIGTMPDAVSMILKGEKSGAWPVKVRNVSLVTSDGLAAPDRGIVCDYLEHPSQCVGTVGNRYTATTPDSWRDLVRAAVAAGAKPTGAFSLRDGSRVLATFEVGVGNGIRTQLLLADAFDCSMKLTCGFTSVRVVCANTLAASLRADSGGMANLRHTASLESKCNILAENIGEAIKTGESVKALFQQAEQSYVTRDQARAAFDALFPEAEKDASPAEKTKADNRRHEAELAAGLGINKVGERAGNLGTLWNAATYLVDRTIDNRGRASNRAVRSGDALDSLLFGTRAKRLQEIQTVIEVIMRDGRVVPMTATKAIEEGVDRQIVGRKILEEMIDAAGAN